MERLERDEISWKVLGYKWPTIGTILRDKIRIMEHTRMKATITI